ERERAGQVTGHAERDRGGVVGQRLDSFDREPVKVRTANSVPWSRVHWGFCHRALTPSKGSPHALQRCSDLQAVALNWAVSRVSGEPQRGQRADGARPSVSGTGPLRRGAAEGGAMPTAASLRRPSGVIQSVLQGGASWVATVTRSNPARFRRVWTSAAISRIAGQPL